MGNDKREPVASVSDAVGWHCNLIKKTRYKPSGSSVPDRSIDEEAASDRARVIYSSAFRRLQHKTQVFTLSQDAAVRSRLTHSLEVASVGRWIAQRIVDRGLGSKLPPEIGSALVSLVETGCLAHDVGNPPFGHFGEAAIRDWFDLNWRDLSKKASGDSRLEQLAQDFLHFDGNPQGKRIVMRLQGLNKEDRQEFGMDLTHSQILAALKYPRGPLDPSVCPGETQSRWKKAGFFESERRKIEEAWKSFGGLFTVQRRFPLAYLVEAADDISYCIGDMEDGIDQQIFKPGQFFDEISPWIDTVSPSAAPLNELRAKATARRAAVKKTERPSEAKDHFITFKAAFTGTMIEEAARVYGDGSAIDIREGRRVELLQGTDANDLLEILKLTARHFLYPADRVQRPFLAGLQVTHGILNAYRGILGLSQEDFSMLRDAWQSANRGAVAEKKLQTLLPLIDGLPSHYLDVYDSAMKDAASITKWGIGNWEWFCRAHLIVDYLSGMTDDFAFRTYQVISGARLD